MATVTICPHCHAEHPVNANRAGQRLRCPQCDQMFEIVLGNSSEPSPEEDIVDLEPIAPPAAAIPPAAPPVPRFQNPPPPAPQAPPPLVPLPPPPPSAAATPASFKSRLGARGKSGGQEAEMDMTPMVDVTFQLLIFFMLTASFVMQRSQQHPKPNLEEKGSQAANSLQEIQEDPEYVTVKIDAAGAFHVSAAAWGDEIEVPSYPELLVKLRQARQGDNQGRIPTRLMVVANGEAIHDRVVAAVDAGSEVGMEDVKLLTVEDDD